MQCCLAVIVFLLVIAAIEGIWNWLAGGGAVGILIALLILVGIGVALAAAGYVYREISESVRLAVGNRLKAKADQSEEDREKYEAFLAREEQRRIKAEKAKEARQLADAEDQRRARWKQDPKQCILEALAEKGEPCFLVSLLKGRQSFIAVSEDQSKLVLGSVNLENGSLGSFEAYAGFDILDFEAGDNVEVSAYTHGSGGLVVFGDIGFGSMGSQTTYDSKVTSSWIFLSVRDMVSPLKQIAFDSPVECREWLGRIKMIQASPLHRPLSPGDDLPLDDAFPLSEDWDMENESPLDDDPLED